MASDVALIDALRDLTQPLDATSERILDAALVCFADGNMRDATMNQIALRAGLGVATVYRRFARRELLLQAVLLREARRAIDNVDAAVARQTSLADKVIEVFPAFIAELHNRPVFADAFRRDTYALHLATVKAAPILELGRGYLSGLIRGWQEQGLAMDLDADLVADIYARLAHSIALAPDGPIPMHDERAIRAFARTYLTRLLGIS